MHFVVNGVGYTGSRVLAALPAGRATGINRSPVAEFDDDRIITLDLDHADSTELRLPARFTLLYTVPPSTDSLDDLRLQRFLAVLDPSPEHFVYISTSGVYGDCAGRMVSEADTPAPVTDRARRRFAAEKMLQRWCNMNECELYILRSPAIYGPGRLGIDKIRAGKAVLCEAESSPGNRIHVDDLAACCIAAMTGNKVPGIYNIADGDFRSPTWFANTVADMAGLDPPPTITRAQAKETLSAARLSFLSESRKLDTTKMRETLEFSPTYTNPEDGIRASLVVDDSPQKKTQKMNR
jgi:nucleoside-diphosphate-sugar epimerase